MSAAEIVEQLGGQWHGSYGVCRCPAHKDAEPSLSVSDGEGGRLLVRCHAGCDFRDVMRALEAGGIDHQPDTTPKPAPARRDHTEAIQRIWSASKPAPLLTTYLLHRGITMAPPACLRLHGGLDHRPTETRWPAMVASVDNGDGRVGVHRTFLRSDGRGKAPIEPAKMALGDLRDGAVRLAPAGDVLGISEGIETGLAAMILHGIPAWAALSSSRLDKLTIPVNVRRVAIFADNDVAGRQAAEKAAKR
ncbi:toprim domain-containing protein, partial [Streptomyces sp. 2MCAF27]